MEFESENFVAAMLPQPVHAIGTVTAIGDGEALVVRGEFGDLAVRRALSCLVEPQEGDRVLVSGPALDQGWIIAVLERKGGSPTRLRLDGDVEAIVRGGTLSVRADAAVRVEASEVHVRARQAAAIVDELNVVGRQATVSMGSLHFSGNRLETLVDSVSQFAGRSLRVIEGLDQVRCGNADLQATGALSLRGRVVLATAEELVKIDGGQIHLG